MKYSRIFSPFWIIFLFAGVLCSPVWGQGESAQKKPASKSDETSKPPQVDPVPVKTIDSLPLKTRSFTFVRVKYSAVGGHGPEMRWAIDYPGSDQSFSAWFAEKTGLKTDPQGKVMTLTAPELQAYPFLYIVEPGRL